MSLLDTASLIVTPNGYKEGTLYSVSPSDGSGDMSVVRATTATRVNSAGLIELVPYNLVTWSQDFSNANWVKSNAPTMTYNSAIAPDGTMTSTGVQDTTGGSYKSVYQIKTNVSSNSTFTCSIYVKKEISEIAYGGISMYFSGGTVDAFYGIVNAVNGTVTITSSTITPTIQVISEGNYWRIICTATDTGSNTNLLVEYYPTISTNGTTLGQGIGSVRTIWGAQLVEGTLPKDYQKTETRLNIPRLDYSNGTCPSLLVEPQRTNLVTYSEQFDHPSWTKDNVTITANTTESPSGIQNADTLIGNGINDSHYIYNSGYSVVSGNTYTISTYAKKNTNNFIQLQGFTPAFGVNVWANFDLNNGIVGSIGSSTMAKIDDVGNGWYRCSITGTAILTTGTVDILLLVTSATSIRGEVNSLSTSVNLWGFQSELGSYPTSYIPTTSASVTRNADVVSKTGISSLIGQTEGTLFVDANISLNSDTRLLLDVQDGGNADLFQFILGSNNLIVTVYDNSVLQSYLDAGYCLGRKKIALGYKANDFVLYINGVQVATDTSGSVPNTSIIALGTLYIASGYELGDSINQTALWKTRLTNTQLAQLTTI
jgi:hypothetical protein